MSNPQPTQWSTVRQDELTVIRNSHQTPPGETELVGVAISGGGIRSATFGLGVLEALKNFDLLRRVHYLSTVSGGGYIGAWFTANCHRTAARRTPSGAGDWRDPGTDWNDSIAHLRRYSNYLSPEVGFFSADTWSMVTIWLRNALLVQLTVIAAIACVLLLPRLLIVLFEWWPRVHYWRWTSVLVFIIGMVGIAGNQLRVSTRTDPGLLQARHATRGAVGALALLGLAGAIAWRCAFDPFAGGEVKLLPALGIAMLLVLAGFLLLPLGVRANGWLKRNRADRPTRLNYTQPQVQYLVVIPMLLTGFLMGAVLWGETVNGELSRLDSYGALFGAAFKYWPFPLSVVFCSLLLLSACSVRSLRRHWAPALLAPAVCVLVLHALLCAIMLCLHGLHARKVDGLAHAFVWAPPMVLLAFSLTIVVLMGVLGRQSTEGSREWWSRFGAWLLIYGGAWLLVAVAAVYSPLFVEWLRTFSWATLAPTAGGWLATVFAGLFAGHSESTGSQGKAEPPSAGSRARQLLAHAAPFVFIAGLLVGVSQLLNLIVDVNSAGGTYWSLAGGPMREDFVLTTTWTLLACLGALLLLGFRVDINEFSLNAFYRNRLSRCYLGATRVQPGERHPQNFTAFDDDDDLPLARLARPPAPNAPDDEPVEDADVPIAAARLTGPLHIVNCALNLGGSGDLALHTRHSASFTLTPLYAGSAYEPVRENAPPAEQAAVGESGAGAQSAAGLGFLRTGGYAGKGTPTLGQAISVSGAAASPNMGYHTSPVVAFLLTVFNLRLGWWFPNPSGAATTSPSPWFNLRYMIRELFGGATHASDFLMVSDGGHFENLAVYELVRRQCAVIIASDAECDPDMSFAGLGTLIRMCAVDHQAHIDIDVGSLRRGENRAWSENRCAVGRITYRDGSTGVLVYLKAAMTGHEDTAVLQYKASHERFPHESTGDQFYAEDQFESYRRLGYEAASRAFGTVVDRYAGTRAPSCAPAPTPAHPFVGSPAAAGATLSVAEIARRMLDTCSPTLAHGGHFTDHSARLFDLWERLAANAHLRTLDRAMVDDDLITGRTEGFRAEFYMAFEMIQLMENVYIDLNLEETWDHPDNRGWQRLFEKWTHSDVIRHTWHATSRLFGARFGNFCNRRLGLPLPPAEASPGPAAPVSGPVSARSGGNGRTGAPPPP